MRCNCEKYNKYDWIEIHGVKIDRHMGFTDEDRYKLKPSYCPFCGKSLKEEEKSI